MAPGLQYHRNFAAAIYEAEVHLRKMGAPWSLTKELDKSVSKSRVDIAEISQPACTAVQLAEVTLLKS